jgi:hypothetical protein
MPDLYDRKNMPKVIYCIHALSHYLAKKGIAPKIRNLVGALYFTEEELTGAQQDLDDYQVSMPSFKNVGAAVSQEMLASKELQEHVAATRVQAAWRGYHTRRQISGLLRTLAMQEATYEKLQAYSRGFILRHGAWWESMKMLRQRGGDLSVLKTLIQTISTLDDEELDFEKELRLEQLKQQIIKMIRNNHALEWDIRDLDTKIGLLIRNRITIHDIVESTRDHYKKRFMKKEAIGKCSNSNSSINNPLILTYIGSNL